jgi:predicted amidohydrolase YtcJ
MLFLSEEQAGRFMSTAVKNDLQPAMHCVGDGALIAFLNACLVATNQSFIERIRAVRPGICHGNFMDPEYWDAIKHYSIVIDMQPAWLYLDGATLFDHFGEERMKWFQPYRTLLDQKIPIGGGSDHMLKIEPHRAINLYDPFLGMWTMLTRQPRWTGRVITPDQKVSREEVIRFYTANSAYIIRSEESRGSLEPGKLADFIVLDRDVLQCPVDDLLKVKVLETWLGGKRLAL